MTDSPKSPEETRYSRLPGERKWAPEFREFAPGALEPLEVPPEGISRRRFLSLLSASAALAMGTSCTKIDRGSIVPYTKKPKEVVPGLATYYASTFQEGLTQQGVLVKTREGRPIHLEGNAEHSQFRGKVSLRAIADLLGLYDPDRLRSPRVEGNPSGWSEVEWSEAEARIIDVLKEARNAEKPVLLMTGALVSPTQKALVDELKRALPTLRHAAWEPAADQAELSALKNIYGETRLPRLRYDRAQVILSLQADFLGVDGSAAGAIREFATRRKPENPRESMNRLWVLEGAMSLTGSNADHRISVKPSKIAALAFALARILHEKHGISLPSGIGPETLKPFNLETLVRELGLSLDGFQTLAKDLKEAGKAALVLAGPGLPEEAHVASHLLNGMLAAEGNTADASLAPPPVELLGLGELRDLLQEMSRGNFTAAIFWGVNPAYAFPDRTAWNSASEKIPLKVGIGLYLDETAEDCQVVLPEHHWLEAWGDYEPTADLLTLRQPATGPLHNTRQGEDILLDLLRGLGGKVPEGYLAYLKARWEREVAPRNTPVPFQEFWNAALQNGVLARKVPPLPPRILRGEGVVQAARNAVKPALEDLELVLSFGPAVCDGRYGNNGWLQELPHPVTKLTWGNAALLSATDAKNLGVQDGDLVKIEAGGRAIEIPVLIQPGQASGVVSVELGYGREAGNVAKDVGVNASPLLNPSSSSPAFSRGVKISPVGGRKDLSQTQEHHRMEGRDIARSWSREEYAEAVEKEHRKHELVSLFPEQKFPQHKWGMAIDLSACVGCSGCVIACQSENNIPVVGPEEVARGREMHWIRIDRYYEGDPRDPAVLHQPILCQHCDNAPCETVCPVNATTHSPDGLNQMTYNRCVGTRYCANNCPYKVRRFNFFDFTSTKKEPEGLVFNPEVTVRPRGVMEKCTFCIQRIQDARQRAKLEGRPIRDGEIRPACAAACPAEAIIFGDLKDPESKVSKLSGSDRGYRVLEELGVKPAVTYLADIKNPSGEGEDHEA